MKCSELWLREWVNPKLSRNELAERLTMSGLEVEELIPAGQAFSNVVVGLIKKIDKHPNSDHLTICQVSIGKSRDLQIVCGASNVKIGLKAPVALVNAVLLGEPILETTIQGVTSEGMLCSERELGLSDDHTGLFALPPDAKVGADLRKHMKLDDFIFDLYITPNRGDCLSVRGLAREVATLTQTSLQEKRIEPIPVEKNSLTLPVKIKKEAESLCPHYVGRVIRNIKTDVSTPLWLKECLRRSGIRAIHPIVDITNFVMLELGQPMHAFDLKRLGGNKNNDKEIVVRLSKSGEEINLLDGSKQTLDAKTLVIADHQNPIAIAGVMGGLDSSVTLTTSDIFLESAYFSSEVIARQRQYYHLNSESSYRFERGVDPTIQREALERATQLVLEIAGGEAGRVVDIKYAKYLPRRKKIAISEDKITKVLGIRISSHELERLFKALDFTYQKKKKTWLVTVPLYRFDLILPEDLIEEIARLYGYDRIPTHTLHARLSAHAPKWDIYQLKQFLSDQGFHETLSYSFIDEKLQSLFDPGEAPKRLINPVVSDMSVMRTNLWPGLINTLLYNKSRQYPRIQIFEMGICFQNKNEKIQEQSKLAGLMSGLVAHEQWGLPARLTDFYDIKGHIEALFSFLKLKDQLNFVEIKHDALHPGQTAAIYLNNEKVGIFGALHPKIQQNLNLSDPVFLFELELSLLLKKPQEVLLKEISKFPEIRRDIAILVNEAIPAKVIQDTIKMTAGEWLKDVFIFDVYQGKGISPGLKSIALALIFQHPTRTLIDDEITTQMGTVIETLKGQMGAVLRS